MCLACPLVFKSTVIHTKTYDLFLYHNLRKSFLMFYYRRLSFYLYEIQPNQQWKEEPDRSDLRPACLTSLLDLIWDHPVRSVAGRYCETWRQPLQHSLLQLQKNIFEKNVPKGWTNILKKVLNHFFLLCCMYFSFHKQHNTNVVLQTAQPQTFIWVKCIFTRYI